MSNENLLDLLQWGRACEDADSRASDGGICGAHGASMGPRL